MVLDISLTSDLIRFYPNWVEKRFEDGFFAIETTKTNHIYELSPKNFELIVFETKNPYNLLKIAPKLKNKGFNLLFVITLTPYDNTVEPGLDKKEVFASIKELSKEFGRETIIWKYSPIIINSEFSEDYHYKKFSGMCNKLKPFISGCVCDFVQPYTPPVHSSLYVPEISLEKKKEIALEFQKILKDNDVPLYKNKTLLNEKLKEICSLSVKGEVPVLDMGLPCTCKGNCEYCYSEGNRPLERKTENYISSPLLIGKVDTTKKHVKKRPTALV